MESLHLHDIKYSSLKTIQIKYTKYTNTRKHQKFSFPLIDLFSTILLNWKKKNWLSFNNAISNNKINWNRMSSIRPHRYMTAWRDRPIGAWDAARQPSEGDRSLVASTISRFQLHLTPPSPPLPHHHRPQRWVRAWYTSTVIQRKLYTPRRSRWREPNFTWAFLTFWLYSMRIHPCVYAYQYMYRFIYTYIRLWHFFVASCFFILFLSVSQTDISNCRRKNIIMYLKCIFFFSSFKSKFGKTKIIEVNKGIIFIMNKCNNLR